MTGKEDTKKGMKRKGEIKRVIVWGYQAFVFGGKAPKGFGGNETRGKEKWQKSAR